MKILYFCNVNRESKAAVGVFKKIHSQVNILRKADNVVDLAFYTDSCTYSVIDEQSNTLLTIDLKQMKGNRRTKEIIKKLEGFITQNKYFCVYSRFETYSIALALFYKHLSRKGCTVLLEVPTYPITQRWTTIKTSLEQRMFTTALHQLYNTTINSLGIFYFKSGVSRIVNNNGFSEIWGIKTLKIHNAVDVSAMPKHNQRHIDDSHVTLIGVANIAKWHGYDRVILGMKEYYRSNPRTDVIFHIVGDGLEVANLKSLASDSIVSEKIIFHGTVVGAELNRLFDDSDIGVSILGSHRSHMKTCDSLKSKEYCARNLPFITGMIEDLYIDKEFVFVVKDDESPIDIKQVVEFAIDMRHRPDIQTIMESYAVKNCSWDSAFLSVIDFIKENDHE